ncbi:hypothetical protein [Synechococcus sp. UW140]|uniref:hypothetical protein n=1 Tax=Synechococcus sp. UW140 TaxID=368503 RepID=UPI0025CE3928|nr:hypothetical protein [Synechococcus sp. UW140]
MSSNHVAILAGIAIILSLLSFWATRNKAIKGTLNKIKSKEIERDKQINNINKQINEIKEQLAKESFRISSLAQDNISSNESLALEEGLEKVQKDLQLISHTVSFHSKDIQWMKNHSQTQDTGLIAYEITPQEPNSTVEISIFPQNNNLPRSLNTKGNVKFENLEEAAKQLLPSQLPEPFEQISKRYQDAINRGDRQALRQMQFKELNITSESENSLIKGNSDDGTKLEAVVAGGSYLIIVSEGRYWLFPTAQTLESFSMNQPQKGIFSYERELLSKPVIKKPAEVLEEGDYWIIKQFGKVSVPG